jgi:hypothetical protein
VPKSAAIWGSSESVTRTCAWLAKPATASSTMERVGLVDGVDDTEDRYYFAAIRPQGRVPANSEKRRPVDRVELAGSLPRESDKDE